MRTRIAAALAAISLLAGCGYVGEPLAPALNIPVAIKDLRALEYGDNLVIEFTAPALSTEGVVLRALTGVELRIGPTEPDFNVDRWAPKARRVDAEILKPGDVLKEVPARDFVGKEIVIAARAIGPKGRAGAWSNLAILTVIEPLRQPAGLKAVAAPEGVQLSWSSPHAKFRIFRATGEEKPAPIADADGTTYSDTSAAFDTAYRYFVQAIQDKAESQVSETAKITPIDTFPPAVPAGLTATAGSGSVELSWERNTESDFRGYRVYRAPETGSFARIAENVDTPVYSDKTVEPNKKYRYAITSFDLKGNESQQSPPVEIVSPEKP
jgi:hypothetical protein